MQAVLEAMAEGLGFFTFEAMLFIAMGVLITTIIAIIPGLGGIFVLVMLLSFATLASPENGLALMIGALAATSTGNTITAVLFGIPGTASGAMLVFDGYPLAKQGQGARAVAAGLTASAVGGITGALVLGAVMPFARTLVLAMSSPEYFALMALAIVMMSRIGRGDTLKLLASGLLGLLMGFIGLEISTNTPRYAFGTLYLWQGLPLISTLLGLFAIVEMLTLMQKRGRIAEFSGGEFSSYRGTLQGIKDVFIRWPTTLRGGAIGVLVGMMPGVGTPVAGFISYAQASQTAKSPEPFGEGNIEGVIGPDSATNATDGGQLIPTLAFGIPGGAIMAVLLLALVALGYQTGPAMIEANLSLLWSIVYILIIANIMAVILCLGISPLVAKLTFVEGRYIVPAVIALAAVGAFTATGNVGDLIALGVFGLLGYWMNSAGYSRAIFIIGMVLAPLLEQHFLLAMRVHGTDSFTRPITMVLIMFIVATAAWPVLKPSMSRVWRGLRSMVAQAS